MKTITLNDEEELFLKTYLPKLKVVEECPPEMVVPLYKIRDNILLKLN